MRVVTIMAVFVVMVGIGIEHHIVPFGIVAIKVFDFIKIAIGEHVQQFIQSGHAFYPKTGFVCGGIFMDDGGSVLVPSHPIAIVGADYVGIGGNDIVCALHHARNHFGFGGIVM